jgi:hypothetical protein
MLPNPTTVVPIKSDLKYKGTAIVKVVNEDSSAMDVAGLLLLLLLLFFFQFSSIVFQPLRITI